MRAVWQASTHRGAAFSPDCAGKTWTACDGQPLKGRSTVLQPELEIYGSRAEVPRNVDHHQPRFLPAALFAGGMPAFPGDHAQAGLPAAVFAYGRRSVRKRFDRGAQQLACAHLLLAGSLEQRPFLIGRQPDGNLALIADGGLKAFEIETSDCATHHVAG